MVDIAKSINWDNAKFTEKDDSHDNILMCRGKVTLQKCLIRFTGNNSLIYIDENAEPISLNMRVGSDSVIYIGKNIFVNKTSDIYATERKNVIIGNEVMFAKELCFRTADPHPIYDCKTKERINPSKSILIGDRVWIGQDSLILKGTCIGSGAIIGGHSVVAGKKISSNSLYAGNPARKIKEGVFYGDHRATHDFDEDEEKASMIYHGDDPDRYAYMLDDSTISLEEIDKEWASISKAKDKVKVIERRLVNNNSKNRFFQS